ncbi:ABC transporter related [Rhodoferax ferrireducens T118]|uniref:Cyclolysin secretion/processing ATP-binding protein CyaB n=1 Tax=Albidiferax ferrireducens (strain ATCC BAA-621 / DSM 15236 / T118) TaxID=338969 RepID=Q21RY3_ALBFT|nr:type I secretion system permease/ATPase [Rhodoferax ferrireducens]ABD71470.1 ABC transporter related [Rhodoferax ferrireducens T118]
MWNLEGAGSLSPTVTASDELLDCLLIVARAHGEVPTRDALMAGLPAEHSRLTPGLFSRAARRAHLSSQLVSCPLTGLKAVLLPAIALLQGERACVVLGFNEDRSRANVVYPELGDAPVQVPLSTLEADYLGTSIYARPTQRFDARTPEVRAGRHGHWFWGVIGESRPLYRDVLLAALLANLFALGMPLFTMNVYDRVVPNHAFETLWVLALGLLLMLISDLVLRTMRGRFVDLASSRADVKLSAFIMERVLGMRMEQRPASAGSFASNLRAFESVRDFIGSATVVAFIDLPFALIFMVVIGLISWLMLIPLCIGAAIMVLYALAVQGRMHELAETTYRAGAQRNATLIEGLVGFETLKALAAEAPIQRKWEKSAALLARVGAQLRLLSSTASNTSAFVQQFINLAIVIIGVYLISERDLTMGGLIACTMLASRAMAPVGQVAGLLVQYHTAATALTSLNEMMAREVERPEGTSFISRGRLKGALEFRDVSFTYPGQSTPSLRNLTFSIKPGEKVAILGRIGSGKTTLEKLILGLYLPSEGAVLVDGIDLRQLDPAELRRQIGYVQQDVMLFYGSLRENITLGAPLADDAAIIKAAEIGGIIGLVNQHPKGFDMLVGERGESLSGGQRQGVAIARAVINDPPIMLLDEPTSSMDYSSEDDIKRRLTEYAQGKTVVLISHRTSLLDLADRIIVMDGGRIMADGPKEQVVTALRQGRIGKAT